LHFATEVALWGWKTAGGLGGKCKEWTCCPAERRHQGRGLTASSLYSKQEELNALLTISHEWKRGTVSLFLLVAETKAAPKTTS